MEVSLRSIGGAQYLQYQQGINNCVPDDPHAKVKFQIPSFLGSYGAEKYHDWEMILDQKFSAYLMPKLHRVQYASSAFKDFAIIWWTGLAAEGALPTTWKELKIAMRDRFVPPSYHRDLHKNLMCLDQGDKSVEDYDVDYKEFNIVNELYQFAMLVEKKLQRRDQQGVAKVGKGGGRKAINPGRIGAGLVAATSEDGGGSGGAKSDMGEVGLMGGQTWSEGRDLGWRPSGALALVQEE
uniref:Retrotransposon gag domain-containing protein n=1 Tax=Oryza brachyantha TaxID=4533 RepID=J3MDX4_ORYBR